MLCPQRCHIQSLCKPQPRLKQRLHHLFKFGLQLRGQLRRARFIRGQRAGLKLLLNLHGHIRPTLQAGGGDTGEFQVPTGCSDGQGGFYAFYFQGLKVIHFALVNLVATVQVQVLQYQHHGLRGQRQLGDTEHTLPHHGIGGIARITHGTGCLRHVQRKTGTEHIAGSHQQTGIKPGQRLIGTQ